MDYIKEAENYLKSYPDLVESVKNMGRELEYLEEEITGSKGIDYSGMPRGGTALPDDRLVNLLYKKQTMEHALTLTRKKIEHIEQILKNLSLCLSFI